MSVLGNQTNATPGDAFFWRIGADTITAREFSSDTVATNTISTGSLSVGGISTTGSITVTGSVTATGDINALNVTATDTLTSYFTNTQYITSYQGANIHGLLLANQIQGSNLVQFPYAILSTISTTSITLDGNTLDTAGQGFGAQLLLNGNPIATASSLTSSILTWSRYPAIANVDMNNFSLTGAGNVQGDNAFFYDGTFENQVVVPTVFATTLNSHQLNTDLISTNTVRADTLYTSTINNAGTLTSKQADVTTINATNITTATLTTTVGGSVSADSGTYKDLTVTNQTNLNGLAVAGAATFSSSTRPDFQKGINSGGPNNFNNQNLDNCPNINTQGTRSMTIASANGMDLTAPTRIQLICDGGNDIGSYKPVNIIGKNGNRGQVNITAEPGYINVGTQVQGEVNITANGGGGVTAYATGGNINITANTGSSPILGTLSYSAIKLSGASVLSYAGFASPVVGVPGYNYIQGTLGINLVAGAVSVIPNVPGTVYLYGATGVPQQTGGVRVQSGIGVDFIVPYPTGFIGPEKDLFISGNPAGNKVTLSNVRTLQSDGGVAYGFTSMTTSNFQTSNIVMFGNGTNNGNILGLSGLEQLTNFSNVSSLNVNAKQGNFFLLVPQQVSTQSLFISTINGLPFSAIIAPTIPSTFADLTTSTLQANTISTNNLSAYTLTNLSSIDGYSIAQLVSSVSPQAPAPSTFLQLFTSSFVANTILTSNLSTVSIQAQGITGVSTINGFTIAQFVSSVAPQAPAPSTFQQLFTSSFVANTITGGTSVGLKLLGPGVSIQPDNDYSINLTTTGVGLTTLVTPVQFQIFSPSTIAFGDFRATTLNGLPPVTSIPTNYPQLTVSSLNASNVSTTVLNAGQVLLNGVALGPQVSSFNDLQANTISTGLLTISTINGYNVNQLVNQPVISTFSNIYVSDAAILNQTSVVFTVSSINGYNTSQFLSTPGPTQLVSTFDQFFTSSLGANGITTTNLTAVNAQAPVLNATTISSGGVTVSSINGYTINQLVNPALSTVSTFQQLFTSSLLASNIQTLNISTLNINAYTLNNVSSINTYSIAQLVSSVAPQPPVPSTVNQFYTSSLAVNGITNYQNTNLELTSAGYINIHAGVGVNIFGDTCNVNINAANYNENVGGFTNNNTTLDYNVTAGRNLSMNSSNTLSIYNTNTAPPVGSNDLYIIGQGNTTLAGQNALNLTSQTNLVATGSNNVVISSSNGTSLQCVNSNISVRGNTVTVESIGSNIDIIASQSVLGYAGTKFQFNTPSTILSGDIRANTFNGLPLPTGGGSVTSTFTQLNTRILSNNPVYGNDLLIRAANAIVLNDTGETTVSLGGSLEVTGPATGAVNIQTVTFTSLNQFISLSAYSNITFTAPSTITSNLYVADIFSNPGVGTDINLTAAQTLGESAVSITRNASGTIVDDTVGGYTLNAGPALATQLIATSNITLAPSNSAFITAPSTIELTSPTLLWNGAPISGGATVSTFSNIYVNTISDNASLGQQINLSAYTPGIVSGFTQIVDGDPYFTGDETISIKNVGTYYLTTLYIGDGAGNIYYNGSISIAPGDYFTFTLVAYPAGYLQVAGYDEYAENSINETLNSVGFPAVIQYYTISSYGTNPIQVGTTVVGTSASGFININTSTINISSPTTITGNQINLNTNLFLAQSSNYFDFYTTNSNAEMYLDVAGNAYLAGISSLQLLSSSNIRIEAPEISLSNVSSINGAPYVSGGWTGTALSPLNMDGYEITDATNILTLSTIGAINLNTYSSPIIISPTAFAVDQPFPEPGGGRYIYITNTSESLSWDNVTMVDSHGNTYVSDPFDPTESRSYPVTESIAAGYYTLTITIGDVITTAQINVLGYPLVIYTYTVSGTAEFGWGQGADTISATGQINLNTTLVKFKNPALDATGYLTLDTNAQLNYAAQPTGYNPGSNGPIPLIQYGKVFLSVEENNTLIGGVYTIPIAYDDNGYNLQLTYNTNPPYAPDAGIVWSGQAYTSNSFQIVAQGSNVGAGVTLDWFWTTIGKYPKGTAV